MRDCAGTLFSTLFQKMVTEVSEVLVEMKTLQHSAVLNNCVTVFITILNKLVFFDNHAKKMKTMIVHSERGNNLRIRYYEKGLVKKKTFWDFE